MKNNNINIRNKYNNKVWLLAWLYYMDTDSFIVYIKTEDIYIDIAGDVEVRLDTSSYELEEPLPKKKRMLLD